VEDSERVLTDGNFLSCFKHLVRLRRSLQHKSPASSRLCCLAQHGYRCFVDEDRRLRHFFQLSKPSHVVEVAVGEQNLCNLPFFFLCQRRNFRAVPGGINDCCLIRLITGDEIAVCLKRSEWEHSYL